VDEFGEKLLEELDYVQEARNIQVGPIWRLAARIGCQEWCCGLPASMRHRRGPVVAACPACWGGTLTRHCYPPLPPALSCPQDFYANFEGDPLVKIPWVRRDLSGPKVLVMEWIDGIRWAGWAGCGAGCRVLRALCVRMCCV
jgi:hypothetical protein